MHIGFDAKRLFTNTAGLRNYAQNITEALIRYYPQHTYYFFTPKFDNRFYNELPFLKGDNVHIVTPNSFLHTHLHTYWRSRALVKSSQFKKLDIYHGLSNEMPVRAHYVVNTVVTIHDVIFKHFPEYYKPIDRRIYDGKTQYAVNHAKAIIAINHQTRNDLIELYNGDPAKIHYIEQPAKPNFSAELDNAYLNEVKQNFHLPPSFILYVGTIEPRKNLKLIIEAMALIPADKRPHLVAIGRATPYLDSVKEAINTHNLMGQVQFLHHVSNTELSAIYHLASLYVNPSLLEGFGAPILEALTCGTPVLCSDGPYFKDTFEERCTYAGVNDITDWTKKIQSLYNSSFRPVYNLEAFTHQAVAHKIMRLYESLV